MTEREFHKACYKLLQETYPQLISGIKESLKIGMKEKHFKAQQCATEGQVGSQIIMGAYYYAKHRKEKKMKRAK